MLAFAQSFIDGKDLLVAAAIALLLLLGVPKIDWSRSKEIMIGIKSFFIRIKFFDQSKSEKAGRREEGTNKGDDVRSPPGDTAPMRDHPQGSESGRVPEKPVAVPVVRSVRRWAGLETVCRGRGSPEFLRAVDWALRVRQEGCSQGLEKWHEAPEGGLVPEKREERKERKPAAVPVVGSVRRWVGKLVAGLVAVLVIVGGIVGGGYFGWVQQEEVTLMGGSHWVPVEEAERRQTATRQQAQVAEEGAVVGEMVRIPMGTFRMGDLGGDGQSAARPVHSVTVPSFWMGKYEVTFSQWDACVADGGCSYTPSDRGFGRGNRPVMNVSWNDIQAFIVWLNRKTGDGYRLPTESEWEYAARAGSETLYSWGDEIEVNRANCDGCGGQWDARDRTAPVGSFPANSWGLHDMHGNVLEWTEDCWNDGYEGAPGDGSAWLIRNCRGRVIRGGSWYTSPWGLRSSSRGRANRSDRGDLLGFRLARNG